MNRYLFNYDFFQDIDNEHKAYWLGFLCADGCILDMKLKSGKKIPQTVQISISVNDIELIYKFMNDIGLEKEIYIGEAKNKKSTTKYAKLCAGSNKMCEDLISHGCTQRKSCTLKFPDIEDCLVRHFIRGYFDGDGSVYFCERFQYDKRRGKEYLNQHFVCNFQGTYDFLSKLRFILEESNIKCGKIRKGHGNIYTFEFSSRESVTSFYHYIYDGATVYLNRKHEKFINTFEYLGMAP